MGDASCKLQAASRAAQFGTARYQHLMPRGPVGAKDEDGEAGTPASPWCTASEEVICMDMHSLEQEMLG